MNTSQLLKLKVVGLCLGTALLLAGCSLPQSPFYPETLPSPSPTALPTTEAIQTALTEGAAAREAGDYTTGETKLAWAFDAALALENKTLAIETGNNASIQYRLSAGRATRNKQTAQAQSFSAKSLDVYQKLRDKAWFDEQDPALARNWAHALLYAGKIDEAVPALKTSLELQTLPAAQGDESNHLAAAYLAQGKSAEAQTLFTKGISLVEKNNGSKIWLTFGLMTKATWQAQNNQSAAATKTIQDALKIVEENNLAVRKEELTYMATLPTEEIDVLKVVGTPN